MTAQLCDEKITDHGDHLDLINNALELCDCCFYGVPRSYSTFFLFDLGHEHYSPFQINRNCTFNDSTLVLQCVCV